MLETQGEQIENSQLKGWNFDETGNIGRSSVGRFSRLSEQEQDIILESINVIRISGRGLDYYSCTISSIEEICENLGYEFYNYGKSNFRKKLITFKRNDQFQRIRRGYPTGMYYPIEIIGS